MTLLSKDVIKLSFAVIERDRLSRYTAAYSRGTAPRSVQERGSIAGVRWEQDKDGIERYTTEVHADEMNMLDRANPAAGGENANRPAATTAATPASAQLRDEEVDDLPF